MLRRRHKPGNDRVPSRTATTSRQQAHTASESAPALTLQEPDISSSQKLHDAKSLEESLTSTSAAVPHNTVGSSSSTLPSSCEKLVVGAAESAPALALQDPDILSFGEEGSIATGLCTVQHNSADCSPPSSFSLGSPIFARNPSDWYQTFFIRMDRGGSFYTYPNVGGPFQSLQQADDAIKNHVHALKRPEMLAPDEHNPVDWLIQRYLYYPDGTPRRGPNSPASKNRRDDLHDMVQALLHQYNDYHKLSEDVAHELKNLLSYEWIFEEGKVYYHFNFTTKTKKADKEYLFFAEVSQPERDWIVTCCCIIGSLDNGLCCGCMESGGGCKIKHPNNTLLYTGGHEGGFLPLGGEPISDSDDEEDEEALKENLRVMFEEYVGKDWSVVRKGSAVELALSSHIC